jgi:hypothetical protein
MHRRIVRETQEIYIRCPTICVALLYCPPHTAHWPLIKKAGDSFELACQVIQLLNYAVLRILLLELALDHKFCELRHDLPRNLLYDPF